MIFDLFWSVLDWFFMCLDYQWFQGHGRIKMSYQFVDLQAQRCQHSIFPFRHIKRATGKGTMNRSHSCFHSHSYLKYRIIVIAIVLAIARGMCMRTHIVAMMYDLLFLRIMICLCTSVRWRWMLRTGWCTCSPRGTRVLSGGLRVWEVSHPLIAHRNKHFAWMGRVRESGNMPSHCCFCCWQPKA